MSGSTSLNFSCKDGKYKGFDLQAGKTWIYPTNYPLRDYQYNIIQEALLKNTLVSLPTGLGKTFIAAVVMYNFYRWYPNGKIIFMAPTRPLVKQQIDACYNIMAIPKETTAELTGSNNQNTRNDVWKEKRVFFVTAQVLSNDLDRITELGPKIKCLVFDEAHRAKGNYAYCLVIRKLLPKTKNFRVLALSATPGNNLSDVEEVVQNLLISHIELRTEDSADVTSYTFQKNLETIVVPIGEKLTEIRERYIQILEKYTRVLLKHRVIQGNCSNLTKGKIFMTLKEFQEKNRTTRCEAYSEITKNLNICVTLYHGFELLIRHGLRGFLSFFQEHSEKPLLRGNTELFDIMRDVGDYLGPPPDINPLPDGTTPEIPENTRFGHPKFYKLCDILLTHFTAQKQNSSRVIVFCEYRESVMEVYAMLLQQKPLIKPKVFIGQGAITQRQQLNVLQSFVKGECNTLISTCIGEEGLDVGEVDLIVCFDVSNKSPVRMIQRIGRTGRKRDGRVVILVTQGKEEQTLRDCLLQKDYMSKTILKSVELSAKLYKENSRMVPDEIAPECMKISISVAKKEAKIKGETIKGMFTRMENALTQGNSKKEFADLIPNSFSFWDKSDPLQLNNSNENKIDFSKNLERQRKLQTTGLIGHSKDSNLLVSLLQFADSKRFNLPMTQEVFLSQFTQVSKQKSKVQKNGGYKQTDLRSMLFKTSCEASNEELEFNQKIYDFLQLTKRISNSCKICETFFDCTQLKNEEETLPTNEWFIPSLEILDCINKENLEKFKESLDPFSEEIPEFPEPESEFSKNNSIAFELPKGFDDVVKKCDSTFFENVDFTQLEKNVAEDLEEVLRFFKLNSLEDLFNTAQKAELLDETIIYEPEENLSPVLTKTQKEKEEEGSPILCSYERIKLLKDRAQKKLFTGEKNGLTQVNVKPKLSNLLEKKESSFYVPRSAKKTQKTLSKEVLDDSLFGVFDETFCEKEEVENIEDIDDIFDTSNLSANNKKAVAISESHTLKNVCKKEDSLKIEEDIDDIFNTTFLSKVEEKFAECSKSQNLRSFAQKEKSEKLKKDTFKSSVLNESKKKLLDLKPVKNDILSDIDDICDISNLATTSTKETKCLKNSGNKNDLSDISDICDISALISENKPKAESKKQDVVKQKEDDLNNLLDLDDICDISIFNSNKLSLKTQSAGEKEQETTKSQVKSLKTVMKTKNMENTNHVKSAIERKQEKLSPVFLSSKFDDRNVNKDNLKHHNNSEKVNKTPESTKTKSQFRQNSLSDFEDSFCFKNFKTPKKLRLNTTAKTKNTDSILKKYLPNHNKSLCEPSTSTKSKSSQESQYTVTQILNIINNDDAKTFDSEDEFETHTPAKNRQKFALSAQKSKQTTKSKLNFESDDEFETSSSPKIKRKNLEKFKMKSKRKREENPFIELEAEVSEEEGVVLSDDESVANEDCLESSFVNDETQVFHNTQMHAHYLQSVKSPKGLPFGFKIPKLPKLNHSEVFSQPVVDVDNTYLNDTFCVESEEISPEDTEPSELEIAEKILQEERKRKRQQKTEKVRKRRVMRIFDDSD